MSAGSRTLAAVVCWFAALSGVGCACQPTVVERRVVVSLDDDLVGKPVVVTLNGVTEGELGIWKAYSVDEFYSPANQMRAGIAKGGELVFDTARSEKVKVLDAADPLWQRWKEQKADHLVVVAYIPGMTDPPAAAAGGDPRRQVLPLNQCLWQDPNEPIRLRVGGTGVAVDTQPLAAARR